MMEVNIAEYIRNITRCSIQEKFKCQDIYLIDAQTGDIIYSAEK